MTNETMTTHILTVCTGNMCRSPLAERLLAYRGEQQGLDLDVSSAGTRARNGVAMHEETQRVLRGYGGIADEFAARLLTPVILRDQDLILTASSRHSAAVSEQAPAAWKKTFTLLEAAAIARANPHATLGDLHRLRKSAPRDGLDVRDPIGQESSVFDSTGAEISDAVDAILELLARS